MEHLINQHITVLNSRVADEPRNNHTIYLDRNELPYPPSPKVIQAIADTVSSINRYPDILGGTLRKALADYAGVAEKEIIICNGSDDLIELVTKVFIAPEQKVLIPNPTFLVYSLATEIMGGNPVFLKRNANFDLNVQEIIDRVTDNTKIIFIANPNNPTGNLVSRDDIIKIVSSVNCLVVVDECYYEMSQQTVSDLINQYENLLVMRSLSKSFALAGLRLGYGIGNEKLIDYLYRGTQIFPINRLAMVAGMAALEDLDYAYSNIKQVCIERENLSQNLKKIGFFVYPSATNFLFVNTKPLEILSANLVKFLRNHNIWIKDFGLKLGLDGYYFRTSVSTPNENQKLQVALEEAISEAP
ncbi:MAG: histidinol-phosphate transaminase [Okeania sp. SIO3C4]|nr:histidinol-phosphate transaminase [Okeania sp. SIO3C4]